MYYSEYSEFRIRETWSSRVSRLIARLELEIRGSALRTAGSPNRIQMRKGGANHKRAHVVGPPETILRRRDSARRV